MLMVVFGAGASYDSIAAHPPGADKRWDEGPIGCYRPPLAKELFDERMHGFGELKNFPECHAIISYLQDPWSSNVEGELERLRDECSDYPRRHEQLAAIRYYLQMAVSQCERGWSGNATKGGTNYVTLLDQIHRWRSPAETVCLVSFNYDTMIERAMASFATPITIMSDYVTDESYKLIKLHGSTNWGRVVTSFEPSEDLESWNRVRALIKNAAELEFNEEFRICDELPIIGTKRTFVFPAIAIPVTTKKAFECPNAHLQALYTFTRNTSKILTIGWRGAEAHFLDVLKRLLPSTVEVLVVSGSDADANETVKNMKSSGLGATFGRSPSGFSDFVRSRAIDEFLRPR